MTDDRREWFIYALRDPRDNAVRYVGFTVNIQKRFYRHIDEAIKGIRKAHIYSWIRSLLLLDLQPVMEVIERGAGEWQSVEMYWIRHYRMNGARLTNSTDGGEGALGHKQSPEHIEKIRQANLGRKHSPEAIEKIRQAHIGSKRSPESIEKMRQAHLGIAVRRVEDGMLFVSIRDAARSISEAARSIDGHATNIHKAIKHGWKCAGYHWERVGETPPADPYTLDGNALIMRID